MKPNGKNEKETHRQGAMVSKKRQGFLCSAFSAAGSRGPDPDRGLRARAAATKELLAFLGALGALAVSLVSFDG